MNILRRRMLHPLRSRHNPIGRAARFIIPIAIASAAIIALWEAESIREIAMADKAMIAELLMVIDGKANMVERTGNYEVHYSVNKTTYEVR
jgi:hypothetical protein